MKKTKKKHKAKSILGEIVVERDDTGFCVWVTGIDGAVSTNRFVSATEAAIFIFEKVGEINGKNRALDQ